VRQAIERALQENHQGDPLDQLATLGAPTGDIEQVLAEIDAGRDHPLRDPARRFLERARSGDVDICTSTDVLREILYRAALTTPRRLR